MARDPQSRGTPCVPITRRGMLEIGAAAGLSLLMPSIHAEDAAPAADLKTKLIIDPEAPVADKVATLQTFLGRKFFHKSGIMYSMWRYDSASGEARPWTDAELADQDIGVTIPCGKASYLHGENSTFTSGLFLASQALRFQATRDAEALEFAG